MLYLYRNYQVGRLYTIQVLTEGGHHPLEEALIGL